jgi:hypothetical protein
MQPNFRAVDHTQALFAIDLAMALSAALDRTTFRRSGKNRPFIRYTAT